jgi:glucose-1-phosphate adenylyltransferase
MISGGCIISGSVVERSLLFSSVRVHSFCSIDEAVILPNVEIGRGAQLRRVIIDKGARIPPGMRAGFDPEEDGKRFHVTEKGITLITSDMLGQSLHHER